MKGFLAKLFVVCFVTFMLAAPAYASLIAGTYDSDSDLIQTATWVELLTNGNSTTGWPTTPPWNGTPGGDYSGSTLTMTSSSGLAPNWSFTGARLGPVVNNGGLYTITYGGGSVYNFKFIGDGGLYSAYLTGYCTYRLDGSGHGYDITWIGSGAVIGQPGWTVYAQATGGVETFMNVPPVAWNSDFPTHPLNAHGGTSLNAQYTLTYVPIPGAVWLLGSGLLGLLGLRRRLG